MNYNVAVTCSAVCLSSLYVRLACTSEALEPGKQQCNVVGNGLDTLVVNTAENKL